jgi:hypothetical protein
MILFSSPRKLIPKLGILAICGGSETDISMRQDRRPFLPLQPAITSAVTGCFRALLCVEILWKG